MSNIQSDQSIAFLTVGQLQGLIEQSIKDNLNVLQQYSTEALLKDKITITDAAHILKCHNATVLNYLKKGHLKYIKGTRLLDRDSVIFHRDNFKKCQRV